MLLTFDPHAAGGAPARISRRLQYLKKILESSHPWRDSNGAVSLFFARSVDTAATCAAPRQSSQLQVVNAATAEGQNKRQALQISRRFHLPVTANGLKTPRLAEMGRAETVGGGLQKLTRHVERKKLFQGWFP